MRIGHHHPRSPSLATTERARRPGGYILVEFALLLVPLLLMVGLSVDVGYWYNRVSDIQKAADAAALAGVVWLPDVDAAEDHALEAAARNGFVDGVDGIDITVEQVGERRLRVTISDPEVGSFLFGALGGRSIELKRRGTAEYVLAVPLGSPRNFFGTGVLLRDEPVTGMPAEYLYQSVNPFCTDKVNGDRYQSGHFNDVVSGTCSGTANPEYRPEGYSMYIEARPDRTSPIEVRLYDARYNQSDLTWTEPDGEDCVTTQIPTYTPAPPNGWTGPASGNQQITVTGPAEYQLRSGGSWGPTQTLAWPASVTVARSQIRYRAASITWTPSSTTWTESSNGRNLTGPAEYQVRSGRNWGSTQQVPQGGTRSIDGRVRFRTGQFPSTPETTCTPRTRTVTEGAIDSKRQSGDDAYTFELYGADNTPLNDDDNPLLCERTFYHDTDFDGYEYLGSRRWNTLCTIPSDALPGRYELRVSNSGNASTPLNDGSNQWGLVAKYTDTPEPGLCDGRNDNMCPRVFGRDAISVRAAADTSVASFYLAEIEDIHAGKQLRLELFDPGEGGSTIEIMRPSGTDGDTWTPARFNWQGAALSGSTSGTNVTSIDVTSNRFNGKLIEITVPLNGYDPPDNNNWWQIRYTFAGSVTDRTTWSARITGDPVHLVEEDL